MDPKASDKCACKTEAREITSTEKEETMSRQ